MKRNPFDLKATRTYQDWRDQKLSCLTDRLEDLIVEVADLASPTRAERDALTGRIGRYNLAVYASPHRTEDSEPVQAFARHFGLDHLDSNWLAGEDGLSRISVRSTGTDVPYIPYTDRPIRWHTDGYYNPPDRLIRAMVLHCVRPAQSGGVNRLMDPELAYIALREQNPGWIQALMACDAMTIPLREDHSDPKPRPAQSGPVFSIDDSGQLHLRYTARTRSIDWKNDALTRSAVQALALFLDAPPPPYPVYTVLLESGMGLLCNNVLHDRSAFQDNPGSPRLLYRARYLERIAVP